MHQNCNYLCALNEITMNPDILNLQPQALWKHFSALNAVPRASKKEEKVIAFMQDFAGRLGLDHETDAVGNVIIRKAATTGMEDRQTIVLQSHLDMVHQKNADTTFDFDTQGIEMFVDGDWVKAKGTTLGADNGIGVATIMALLESTDIPHPALEALFTIDEETGMTGALALQGGVLKGSIMLNLDTEDDTELTIGCAGGLDVTAHGHYTTESCIMQHGLKVMVKGLTGGHSGMDIHKGRGNANKIMNRLLYQLHHHFKIELGELNGGGLRNAIPRESTACLNTNHPDEIQTFIASFNQTLQSEYLLTDPKLMITCEAQPVCTHVMSDTDLHNLICVLYACPNGIYRMSPAIEGLVQSSNNIARVQVANGQYTVQCLTRSSVNSEKEDVKDAISAAFALMGAEMIFGGAYPGWTPNPHAAIVKIMSGLYQEMFQAEAHVNACHAGLECGILGQNYPDMEMISFGPTITGAHSPDEQVQISSVQKYWGICWKP